MQCSKSSQVSIRRTTEDHLERSSVSVSGSDTASKPNSIFESPEKDHEKQIESFSLLVKQYPELTRGVKLVLLGSARHEEDLKRVEKLKSLSKSFNVQVCDSNF